MSDQKLEVAPGSIIWLTGPSGSGKSTIARVLRRRMESLEPVEILDDDELKTWMTDRLNFSRWDSDKNVDILGRLARRFAIHGVTVVVADVSPFNEARSNENSRARFRKIPFFEVFVTASLETLQKRKPKGMFRLDSYESPERPNLVINTDTETAEDSTARVLNLVLGGSLG